MSVLQNNVNDLIDARGVYFNFGAFNRKAFIVINFSPIATKLICFQLKCQGSLSKEQHNGLIESAEEQMLQLAP